MSQKLFAFLLLCGWVLTSGAGSSLAQEWASKMFKVKEKDFGNVAKDADVKYEFKFQNIYKEDIHIHSVGSSCGCATPTIEKKTLKTWEESAISVKYNTHAFTGNKSATITVRIDKPYWAEVQLKVKGTIYGNLTIEPSNIDFGDVKQFSKPQQKVRITHRGNTNWSISDIKSNHEHIKVYLSRPYRGRGMVIYDLVVELQPTAPAGYLQNELILFSTEPAGRNQRRESRVPISFAGKVSAPLQVVPDIARIGPIDVGTSGKRRIIVKSDKPFKILDVECQNQDFSVAASTEAKKLHALTVTYKGAEAPGEVKDMLKILTDIDGSAPLEVPAVVTVK